MQKHIENHKLFFNFIIYKIVNIILWMLTAYPSIFFLTENGNILFFLAC